MANTNSSASDQVNAGEHIEDVIEYLKEASNVLGNIATIAGLIKNKLKDENPTYQTDNFNLVDTIWRLANDGQGVSAFQAEEIERNGIRGEVQNG